MTKISMPETLTGQSLDIRADKRRQLKTLFPTAFTETRNAEGALVESIDFERLKAELGTFSEVFESRKERFGLDWPGKSDCMKVMQQPSTGTLLPTRAESVNFDTSENLIIEGDNLEVLKLLQKSYYGKVKMIYIDPPYNTGNEFIYPDNFREGLEAYLRFSGQVDAEGRKQSTNTESSGRYHSNWLSMMYPRLFLAKNLLREDGVIFVSIDDNEVHHLRALLNEIFGEDCFIANFCWRRRTGANDSKKFYVSNDHEYVLCFANSKAFSFNGIIKDTSNYTNPDNDLRGPWASDNLTCNKTAEERPNLFYPILDPETGVKYSCNPNRVWAFEKSRMDRIISEGKVIFPSKADGSPMYKRHLAELRSDKKPLSSWVTTKAEDSVSESESASMAFPLNMTATKQLREILNGQFFDFPKSPIMISQLVQQATISDDIILDFFAGSGTTGHAVINANGIDGGNRKFILVQLPEPTKNRYKVISEITRKRIAEVASNTLGFRAFKLAASNFKVWASDPAHVSDLGKSLQLFADHVTPGRQAEDILYELLLKAGYPLTATIEKLLLAGKEVFAVSEGRLLICLDRRLTLDVIDAMVARTPAMILCLDDGFRGNDQLKVNAVQTVKSHNQNNETDIVFRVV